MTTRQEDIADLNAKLENLAKKRLEVFEEYKQESQVLNEKAKEILEAAGILEEWTALEAEKGELNVRFQKLLDPYNNAIKQVQGFRNWLTSKESPAQEIAKPEISEDAAALAESLDEGSESPE